MDLRIEQPCPQCGGPVPLLETDRILSCPFCGVKNLLQSEGYFRYVLPAGRKAAGGTLLFAPYIRFKGAVYVVAGKSIRHKIIDTTQLGFALPGLPPSLGLRPQAMRLQTLLPGNGARYLRLSSKAQVILERAANLSTLRTVRLKEQILAGEEGNPPRIRVTHEIDDGGRDGFFHRAFIGETISFIYQPLLVRENSIADALTGEIVVQEMDRVADRPLKGSDFNKRWLVRFRATLCPRCGASLDGEGNCLVMTCANCHSAWEIGGQGLREVHWQLVEGDVTSLCHLGFWAITATIDELGVASFADFLERTNQPVLVKREWGQRPMRFWIPAFKIQPKLFLKISRQLCLNQYRFHPAAGRMRGDFSPVTLSSEEARQALKTCLAACAANPGQIFPLLPRVVFRESACTLVFLPFSGSGSDLVQLASGVVIPRNILRLGRSL